MCEIHEVIYREIIKKTGENVGDLIKEKTKSDAHI